jgi:hypothetical protein
VNEPIAAVIVGLLFSISCGFRVTLPLLVVNLLAVYHEITLPSNLTWLGSDATTIILSVACAAETLVHFIPVAGTYVKAMSTPLAFGAGTLLMAVPLGDHNPMYQWTLAAVGGGGLATLTHLGVTSARVATGPVNIASLGGFGIIWNIAETLISVALAALGWLCLMGGWIIGVGILLVLAIILVVLAAKGVARFNKPRPAVS